MQKTTLYNALGVAVGDARQFDVLLGFVGSLV